MGPKFLRKQSRRNGGIAKAQFCFVWEPDDGGFDLSLKEGGKNGLLREMMGNDGSFRFPSFSAIFVGYERVVMFFDPSFRVSAYHFWRLSGFWNKRQPTYLILTKHEYYVEEEG